MKTLATVFCALILFSCASSGVQKLKQFPGKEKGCALDIYTAEKEITRKYDVVCLIDSKTGSTLYDKKTISKAIDLSKPKACECGADALVLVSSDRKGASFFSWGEAYVVVKGIRYK